MKFIVKRNLVLGLVVLAPLFLPAGPGGGDVLLAAEKNALFYNREGQKKQKSADYRSAIHYYRLALERNPDFRASLMGLAESYFALGRYSEARDNYLRLLQLDQANRNASIGLGRTYAYLGDFARSEEILAKVAKQDPGNVENNFARGEMNHLRGRQRLAVSYYNQVIRRNPAHFRSLLGLAILYGERGSFDQAMEYLERSRRVNPVSYRYHMARGEILLLRAGRIEDEDRRRQMIEDAHGALATALQLSPRNSLIENRLVFLDLYRGNTAASLDRARELDGRARHAADPGLNYLIGSLLRKQGRSVREYLPYLRKALDQDPNNSLVRFSVEEALLRNGREFMPLSPLRRQYGRYQYSRARYYDTRNRRDLMDLFLDRTLLIDPRHRAALGAKLEDYRRMGDYEMFLNTLVRLRNLNPGEERLQFRLEQALRRKNAALPYRESLYLVPPAGSGRATYKRTPTRVFIFDFRPEDPFLRYPDAPALFARALRFHLDRPGRVAPFSGRARDQVLDAVRRLGNDDGAPGVYYRPEYIAQVEEFEDPNNPARYLISGRFRLLEGGLRISGDVIEKVSSRRVDRFSYSARGRDAIHELMGRIAGRLRGSLPLTGRVVKVKPGQVFVNLGRVDGVKKDQVLRLSRNGRDLGGVKLAEIGSYVSRAVPVDADWNDLNKGDSVR